MRTEHMPIQPLPFALADLDLEEAWMHARSLDEPEHAPDLRPVPIYDPEVLSSREIRSLLKAEDRPIGLIV